MHGKLDECMARDGAVLYEPMYINIIYFILYIYLGTFLYNFQQCISLLTVSENTNKFACLCRPI